MKLKLGSSEDKVLNLSKKVDSDLVEFEGKMIPRELANSAMRFRKQHDGHIVKKPDIPKIDSKGRSINSDGNPSYIKLLRRGERIPTVMRSKDNSAIGAYLYSFAEARWKHNPRMWQDYVYDGSLGVDYAYIDDIEIKNIIKRYK